jgi:hypothetical protein
MSQKLHIEEMVITGDDLARWHQGEQELCVGGAAVLTPTAWDYVRDHRLRLTRGARTSEPAAPAPPANVADEAQMVPHEPCDLPGRSCGCITEEFGSGFVQPDRCDLCAIHQLKVAGRPNPGCDGCNLNGHCEGEPVSAAVPEALVTQITEQIMKQLQR